MAEAHTFPHERLVAYGLACEFVAHTARLLRGVPRGEAAVAEQLRRAADSVLLNLCEGAARTSGRDKARCYDIAAGSGSECAAALAICTIRRLAAPADIEDARRVLRRVVGALVGLAQSARRRAGP